MKSLSPVISAVVLGKRKAQEPLVDSLVLHLASDLPNPAQIATSASSLPVNDGPPLDSKRTYICSFPGCDKSYTKPSRLAEHERSHTGERPFVCTTCNKAYLRETHLQAHVRSHQPEESKPFCCSETGCGKRFWTAQHLRVHSEVHTGEKPFKCTEPGCSEAFMKHHQMRSHVCTIHAPPGTKSYICPHDKCTKSFNTSQKLRAHTKVHEDKRYTCVHPSCIPARPSESASAIEPTYYPTWTALQHHMRTVHPPTCPHPDCDGRTFGAQKGLRAHMKLHEHREAEAELDKAVGGAGSADEDGADADTDGDGGRPRKKRRGGEMGRDWRCELAGCEKDFKSKKALMMHHNVTHLGRRDHVCPRPNCQRAFAYKHLLQRHMAKLHAAHGASEDDAEDAAGAAGTASDTAEDTDAEAHAGPSAIDALTGRTYATRARAAHALRCPHPDWPPSAAALALLALSHAPGCDFFFTRAYDLRRHLRAEHGVEVAKNAADDWVKLCRARSSDGDQ